LAAESCNFLHRVALVLTHTIDHETGAEIAMADRFPLQQDRPLLLGDSTDKDHAEVRLLTEEYARLREEIEQLREEQRQLRIPAKPNAKSGINPNGIPG
jgi:hypothetical protein